MTTDLPTLPAHIIAWDTERKRAQREHDESARQIPLYVPEYETDQDDHNDTH